MKRLGEFIEPLDIRNKNNIYGSSDVRGISTSKCFIQTKADLNNVSLSSYKIVNTNQFAYVADTSRRGDKIGLAYAETTPCIVSSIYTVFRIKDETKILPRFLMMFFSRFEFDRYARFNSWGSARETFTWEDMCDIRLEIPSIEIQKKYVSVYEGLQANLQSYKRGLDDLKLVCDGYLEQLRKTLDSNKIGKYIMPISRKNMIDCKNVMGVCSDGVFTVTKANVSNVNLQNYTYVCKGEFAFNPSRINLGSIALCEKDCVVSPMYEVFKVKDTNVLNPLYLRLWLQRSEFLRSTSFYAIGSVRDIFDFSLLCEMKIPIPSIDIQNKISDVYKAINRRKYFINELDKKISNICSLLVRGSILENGGR